VLAAVVAFSVTVAPSLASSFLTPQAASKKYVTKAQSKSFVTNKKAAKTYVTNAKASKNFLTKKAAGNLYVAKKTAALSPVSAVSASNVLFSLNSSTVGYIPSAFASFATKAAVSNLIITFSGTASCTNPAKAPTVSQACPITILLDGQPVASKVAFAPATAESSNPSKEPAAAIANSVTITSVATKGGHTVQIEYAGASGLNFQLKSWNLAVEAYPQPEEPEETTAKSSGGKS